MRRWASGDSRLDGRASLDVNSCTEALMQIRSFLGRVVACAGALCAATSLGCGGSGGNTVCDVDFGTLAGTYSFTWTTHNARYLNSCFDDFTDPNPVDPGKVTGCTWDDSSEDETATIELVITEDGDI